MRALLVSLTAVLTCCTGLAICNEPASQPKTEMSIEDMNRQIDMIKENIAKFNNMATEFDRKASELQSHDFTGARRAASIRDELRSLSKDLQDHLKEMEKKRDDMKQQGK